MENMLLHDDASSINIIYDNIYTDEYHILNITNFCTVNNHSLHLFKAKKGKKLKISTNSQIKYTSISLQKIINLDKIVNVNQSFL
jgi:hypothetical protein